MTLTEFMDERYKNREDKDNIFGVDVTESDPKYCDRNICARNEYNGINCDECDINKAESEEV